MVCQFCKADEPATAIYCAMCGNKLSAKWQAKPRLIFTGKVVAWGVGSFVALCAVLLWWDYDPNESTEHMIARHNCAAGRREFGMKDPFELTEAQARLSNACHKVGLW